MEGLKIRIKNQCFDQSSCINFLRIFFCATTQVHDAVVNGNVRKAWRTPPITPSNRQAQQESFSSEYYNEESGNRNNISRQHSHRSNQSSSASFSSTSNSHNHLNSNNKQYPPNGSSTSRSNALLSNISKQQTSDKHNSNREKVSQKLQQRPGERSSTREVLPPYNSHNNKNNRDSTSEEQRTFAGKSDLRNSSSSSGLRMTGDPDTDNDIMAFMRARQQLMEKSILFCYSFNHLF